MLTYDESLAQPDKKPDFKWEQLPALPDRFGFAGSFAGVSDGALIVAGGANFPDGGAPWTGSTKVWYDKIFVLESPQGQWREIGKLPKPLGYGVSLTTADGLLCLGGSNAGGHFSDAFVIRYRKGNIDIVALPSMPEPLANASGVLLGDVVYVTGGITDPAAKEAGNNFWSFDLKKGKEWQVLEPWPGPGRMLSVTGARDNAVYLFSGVELVDGIRNYLTDAYKYVAGKGWTQLAALPQPVAAAPTPAFADTGSKLLIFGGDNGKLAPTAAMLKEKHPGFSAMVLSYDTRNNAWSIASRIPEEKKDDAEHNPNGSVWAPVTTPLVVWNGSVVLPGGEVRPATRTPRILIATPKN